MDGQKILQRVMDPGFIIMIIGAFLTYGAALPARLFAEKHQKRAEMIIKSIGCVIVVLGAVLIFT